MALRLLSAEVVLMKLALHSPLSFPVSINRRISVARVSSGIREGGPKELVFNRRGRRGFRRGTQSLVSAPYPAAAPAGRVRASQRTQRLSLHISRFTESTGRP